MEVLLVNNQLHLGGAETVVHQLWSRIPSTRLLVVESNSTKAEAMYPRLLSRLNHSRLHPLIEKWFPISEWTERRFTKLASDRADIVHIHNFHGSYASVEALAEVAKAKRIVWTFHGLWGVTGGCDHPKGCQRYLERCGNCPQIGLWPIGPVDQTAEELARKKFALTDLPLEIIVPSRYFYRVIESSPIGRKWRLHHIPNGIDPTKFRPSQSSVGKLNLLVVNRNFKDPHKGFEFIRGALRSVKPEGIRLTLVGSHSDWAKGQLKSELEIRTVDYVKEARKMAELYGESHILLFASPAENFPCVILEAMASGCCVVATPSGGVTEQIENGVTGLLAAEISGEALGSTLAEALVQPRIISEVAEAARRAVIDKFSEDQMIEEHLKVYRAIVG
jgi:glycosyltransferase involved in cell wall biosynthesis